MRNWGAIAVVVAALSLCACTRQDQHEAGRETDTAARKAGRVAHKLSDEADEAARKAAQKLKEAAREAKAGWNEQGEKERQKQGK